MRIAHIADFHLPRKRGKKLNGVSPHANLERALAVLRRQTPKPELLILGGDLFDEGAKADYRSVAELFSTLQLPVYTVVGNHDHLGNLSKTPLVPSDSPAVEVSAADSAPAAFRGYYSFDRGSAHFLILYSAGTGKSYGHIDEQQLIWLSEDLHEHRGKPTLIFMHHHPFDSGIPWLDKMKLLNSDAFWEIVPPYANTILGVFAAHLHVQLSCRVRGVLVASCPAVCWQYSGNADAAKAEISTEQPGFNLIDLDDSTTAAGLRIRTVRFAVPEQPGEPQTPEAPRPVPEP